jgi:hypothetical protein
MTTTLDQQFLIAIVLLATFSGGLIAGLFVQKEYSYRYRYRLRIRQNQGEATVRKIVKANFEPPEFHLLNNITLPVQDGTTQIDHILISTKGVFVIETKNYSGWIFANKKSRQWTRVHFRVKNQFQNPIYQNYKHVKVIQDLLEFVPKEQIHSIVVFTGTAEFKTTMPEGAIQHNQLGDYIRAFQEDVLSANRVQFCVGRLECKRYAVTLKTDLEHLAYLEKKFENRE